MASSAAPALGCPESHPVAGGLDPLLRPALRTDHDSASPPLVSCSPLLSHCSLACGGNFWPNLKIRCLPVQLPQCKGPQLTGALVSSWGSQADGEVRADVPPHRVCLSALGCRAIAVGNSSLSSLQNSLKKRGSRSIGKTEKKPSVQVWAPACLVAHQHPGLWCQLETTPGPEVNLGMAVPYPCLQGSPAFQRPCIREGIDVLSHPRCPQPIPCLLYQCSISGLWWL